MIEIRFSDSSNGGEIDLSGLPTDLRDIRQSILNLIQDKDQQVCVVKAAIVDPSPYKVCLSFVSICKGDNPIKITVSKNSLQIEGESKNLETFAGWLEFDDDTWAGYHHHFDYFGNEEWVDVNSSSLVISVRNSVKRGDTT